MDKKNLILNQYEKDKDLYNDFRAKVEVLIKELLIQKGVNYHQITSRLKSKNKLEEKISKKGSKYSSLYDVTDISGIRIITYFEDEVDNVAKIIEEEFIIDNENSIDKRKLESDRFGYKSLHYVVSLNKLRSKLIEYKRFNKLKIEIQVRSILQHAWAEIEHDMGYKGEIAIPENLKRNFHRVAALLETSDKEFVNIKDELKRYKEDVDKKLVSNEGDLKIDKITYTSFIKSDKNVGRIDSRICDATNCVYETDDFEDVDDMIFKRLIYLKIYSISQLRSLLIKNEKKIVELAFQWVGKKSGDSFFSNGISIFYLCYYLIGLSKDLNKIERYFKEFINGFDVEGNRESAMRLLNIITKIEK